MNHVRGQRARLDGVPLSDARSISTLPGIFHSDPRRLHIQHLQQGIVILVEQDGRAGGGPQFHGSAHMIDVSMSDDDLLHLEIVLLNERENIFDVIAGIDHHGFAGGFVPDDRAVALQRPDGKDFVNHGGESSVVGCQSSADLARLGQRPTTKTNDYFCAVAPVLARA